MAKRSSKGGNTDKGEPKTPRTEKRLIEDLNMLKRFIRENNPPFKFESPTKVALSRYGVGYVSKEGYRSGLYMTRKNGRLSLMED